MTYVVYSSFSAELPKLPGIFVAQKPTLTLTAKAKDILVNKIFCHLGSDASEPYIPSPEPCEPPLKKRKISRPAKKRSKQKRKLFKKFLKLKTAKLATKFKDLSEAKAFWSKFISLFHFDRKEEEENLMDFVSILECFQSDSCSVGQPQPPNPLPFTNCDSGVQNLNFPQTAQLNATLHLSFSKSTPRLSNPQVTFVDAANSDSSPLKAASINSTPIRLSKPDLSLEDWPILGSPVTTRKSKASVNTNSNASLNAATSNADVFSAENSSSTGVTSDGFSEMTGDSVYYGFSGFEASGDHESLDVVTFQAECLAGIVSDLTENELVSVLPSSIRSDEFIEEDQISLLLSRNNHVFPFKMFMKSSA